MIPYENNIEEIIKSGAFIVNLSTKAVEDSFRYICG